MKKIISLLSIALITLSCTEGDNAIDYVLDNYGTGAVLKGSPLPQDTDFNFYGPSGTFAIRLEEHDKEDGNLFKDVEVYVSAAGGAEALHTTMPASAFTKNDKGLPQADLIVELSDAASTLGLSPDQIPGGASMVFRLVLNLTNGESYTAKDAASSLTGSYFRSPYQYNKIIKCIPTAPVPGDYTIQMNDSYGDGWNGGFLTVTIDGTSTKFDIAGASGTGNFTVPEGTSTFSVSWSPGDWDSEVTYSISHQPIGGGTSQVALSEGPNPGEGTAGKTMSICPTN